METIEEKIERLRKELYLREHVGHTNEKTQKKIRQNKAKNKK